MESSEKILNNCDVLALIFEYLDFKEHLKLIKICSQFEHAIVNGLWRLMCKNLRFCREYFFSDFQLETENEIFENTFLQFNAVNNVVTDCSLTLEEFHLILHHSSTYVQKLKLENYIHMGLENIISLKYHNLTELTLWGIVVEDAHLQQVAKNCLNLQSFTLTHFRDVTNQSNIRAIGFGEMKGLNKLKIDDMKFTAWNYFDVQQLFCLAHLKTLIININISDTKNNNKKNNTNSIDCVYNIENLTLSYQRPGMAWFQKRTLIRFENLTKLSIKKGFLLRIMKVYQINLMNINNACPKLHELSFTGCYFTFKEFPRMNNLKHLTLARCENIRCEQLDQIFRKLQLKSLSLVGVKMRDAARDIPNYNFISNTLETLNIVDSSQYRNILRTFFNRQHKFKNVSKVRVKMESRFIGNPFEGLCFSHNFPNLQELIMNSLYTSSEDILYLEHLKVLQFDVFTGMSWSYLEILFKHPTLTHVTITPCNLKYYGDVIFPRSCEGLTTKLEYLSLPSVVYERDFIFWSSFRQRNKLLKLDIVTAKVLRK